ncbi:CAF17-like 4Fe-4S cluster assembly/insertion protein YgfZ [Falsiroseomonas selenitidurans]|uniref:Folate-binding protein YgfZ n=1 Tax=Falsiroseomonas selenitidurans TaxID=2716335 RepID=A0ABX1DYK4_9PROT|nr:folate-binding protein YgfZ [Falsiroseomonas selenitidurans]NKC29943.1 folate-binding protein YgfZ [Falsiroseomonas selenitidurans]OYW10328.1 MAG: folate-binding protein YgfZ [Rhodospirillales bacterium 12-71-4]
MPIAGLPERGVVELTGADRLGFLQGLVSNDVALAAPGRAVWAALLTPQGKWLADFFILAEAERLLLEAEAAQVPMLVQRLSRFRLRAQVALRDASGEFHVGAAWGGAVPPAADLAAPDPRLPAAGWRFLATAPFAADATAAEYDLHRLSLGLPDGSRDLEPEKSVLLEGGFDELGGVSWSKGCYMGQELTARTKYRGLLKRRIVPVTVQGGLPPRGTPVLRDGTEVGEMRSARDGHGLALLRLDVLAEGVVLSAGGALLTPRVPDWMKLPAPAA